MRILMVNWAKIWDGATNGGGANGYAQALALELTSHGHTVATLSSGTTYVPRDDSLQTHGPCEVRRHDDWLGIQAYEVINSPVLAPSLRQFKDPQAEISSPILERIIAEFATHVAPDIVHIHNIEGFSAGCISAFREAASNPAIIFSLHNYHTICPQVYLLQGHRRLCHNAEGGSACATCIDVPSPTIERQRLMRDYTATWQAAHPPAQSPPPPPPQRIPMQTWHQLLHELREIGKPPPEPPATHDVQSSPPPAPPGLPLGRPVASPSRDTETRGNTRSLIGEEGPGFQPTPDHPDWQPMSNEACADPTTNTPVNSYGRRRLAMIAMLNSCDRVLAVSNFVRDKYVAMGVDPERIETLPIGSRAVSLAQRHPELLFEPPPRTRESPRPLRLIFMGYNHWYKGLPMLADALELLPPAILQQIDLTLYALEGHHVEWRFRRLEPRLARLQFSAGYLPRDIPWMLGGKDLGLVPSVWWDNGPQTVFEFLACGVPVLGAAMGGIPDFVVDGENGLLFRGNDRYHLAERLTEAVLDMELVGSLRAGVRAPKSMEVHTDEIEAVYRNCVSCGSLARPASGDPRGPGDSHRSSGGS